MPTSLLHKSGFISFRMCVCVFSCLRLLCGAFCCVFVLFFEVQIPLNKELQKVLFYSQRSLISVSNQLASRCHYVLLKLSFSLAGFAIQFLINHFVSHFSKLSTKLSLFWKFFRGFNYRIFWKILLILV